MPGDSVRIRFFGFEPNAALTLALQTYIPVARQQIGAGIGDGQGNGIIEGIIPRDAPIGEASIGVSSGLCYIDVFIVVIGSAEAIFVDDDTVVPGQRIKVSAGGFLPNSMVNLTIDRHPTQGECLPVACREIGRAALTSADGSVVIDARIPADVAPGIHYLFANGYSPDGISDFTVGAAIAVLPTSTLPPTDSD